MKRKLLIGVIAVLGTVVALGLSMLTAGALLAAWIYLVWMVRKKKTNIFHDQMEPELAERRLKRLKTFLWIAGISFAVFIVGTILHNAIYGLTQIEEPVFFLIALFSLVPFAVGTIGGLVIFIKGQRKTT